MSERPLKDIPSQVADWRRAEALAYGEDEIRSNPYNLEDRLEAYHYGLDVARAAQVAEFLSPNINPEGDALTEQRLKGLLERVGETSL